MPHSVEQVTLTTIGLGILMVLCTLALRRWGLDAVPDPLIVLWKKWEESGRPELARSSQRKPIGAGGSQRRIVRAKPIVAGTRPDRQRPVRASATGGTGGPRDDVPLSDTPEGSADEPPEPKIAFRHRFRRGMRKTREYLNRDVREAFGQGPVPEAFDKLEEALVSADVGVATATGLVGELRERTDLTSDTLPGALKDVMVARLADPDRRLRLSREKLSVWVVCGVNGTGKTTSIAKLAARAKSLGLKTCLAAADTFRAAAAEQLEEWGRRLDVPVIRQAAGADPGAVVFDAIAHARAQELNLVIVDTAGRLHTRKPLMDELQKVVRVIQRDDNALITECLLVMDATTGQNGIAQAKAFKDAVGVTGLVLAKLDGTAKGGVVFAIERELGVPVKAVGTGEHHRDLVPFEPVAFVDALLGLGEETEKDQR